MLIICLTVLILFARDDKDNCTGILSKSLRVIVVSEYLGRG